MAEWQLGRAKEARDAYNGSVQRMLENNPNDQQQRRFRAEAAELLGIDVAEPTSATTDH